MKRKGLILAGGKGTRLLPATKTQNKHLVPILNRPMILFPLDTLKSLGITDIMIVSGGGHIGGIAEFLGDGSEFGVQLTYRVQMEAGGIGQALGLAKDFVGNDSVAVILGDNIFGDISMMEIPEGVGTEGAFFLFAPVTDPERFGVPVFEDSMNEIGVNRAKLITIEEKPVEPKSDFAVTGFYIYPPDVFDIVKTLKPSARGEIEITSVNNHYIEQRKCAYAFLDCFWSDAGTPESLKTTIDWAYQNMLEKDLEKKSLDK